MIIGIDASRAFLKNRTGIEEYSYRVIENLMRNIPEEVRVVLYVRSDQRPTTKNQQQEKKTKDENVQECVDGRRSKVEGFPKNWEVREIKWRRFWTQGGLAWEMFRRPVDVLFVPAHTVPWMHPKRTVVVIHGLEYEMCPGAYSFWEKLFMRVTIRLSCRWASAIVSVSENTKKDLMKFYGVAEEKIRVIYEGYEVQGTRCKEQIMENEEWKMENGMQENFEFRISNFDSKFKIQNSKFLLFIGRIEERKNVVRIIEAFEMLKKKYKIPHKLILAGKPGYGYKNIKYIIENSTVREEIVALGYVTEKEKWILLQNAEVLLFPSLYEGFGLPILEAQSVGVPVVTSTVSSMPEVVDKQQATNSKQQGKNKEGQKRKAECSAVLVDPYDVSSIAEGVHAILSSEEKKSQLIDGGFQNVKRFSWEKCAEEIAFLLEK